MAEKAQYDVTLGGAHDIPANMQLAPFVAARSQEILVMKSSIATENNSKLAFQTLPKHMRRRAMSHNVKRLPRRLRQIHLNQMKKSGMPTQQKRPSRKYRRRPRNLMEEYTKRANKKYKWMQTHIWHAKRFRMVEKWGFKLPERPCDKSFRACYRAAAKHCLVQDISYFSCIEISGSRDLIIDKFKLLTQPSVGLTIGAKAFSAGNREGNITLFEPQGKAIGDVKFVWCPQNGETSQLWIWVHPAFSTQVLTNFITIFDLNPTLTHYTNSINGVVLTEFKNEFSRFRLTGPLSNAILQDAFVLFDRKSTDLNIPWIEEYVKENVTSVDNQTEFWKSLKNVGNLSELSPHLVLGVIVQDPRFNLPKVRLKCESDFGSGFVEAPADISASPIWNATFRKQAADAKISNAKITELRSNLLVPGSKLLGAEAFVPVMLIQRPGNVNIGLGSGCDVVVPAIWATSFWLAIIMRGARVGGLREMNSMYFEMGVPDFLLPDTEAGRAEEKALSQEYKSKFFKKPPAKRINFNKFSIASPFDWNWTLLLKEWSDNSQPVEDFYVVRSRKVLCDIQDFISGKCKTVPNCARDNCLIPVKLVCSEKGSPQPFSIICLPKGGTAKEDPVEPISADKYQKIRKETRDEHQTYLKKSRKRRILERKKSHKASEITEAHRETLKNYTKKMRALWLPEPSIIRKSCSREVIGLVKSGGFSLSIGQSSAVGYIASGALSALEKLRPRNKILVRNTNTRQYRWAKLNIVIEKY